VDDDLLRTRWASYFSAEGDPFYNPNLDLKAADHTLRADGGCRRLAKARVTVLGERM
jgi:hypothetical protein